MAIVYLAHDLKHSRPVAVKVLDPEFGGTQFKDRFFREIEIAAKLAHPNILPLHDSGTAGGRLYYVTPYVEGESLRAWLEREQRLPVDVAIRLAGEIADALDYAHRRGVVHRDIKPANILIADGHAIVADFGIATALAGNDSQRLTSSGIVLGTPGYMSPEQSLGGDVDAKSDIYSLACVLFEMLIGELPRSASDVSAKLQSAQPAIPRQIRSAIARGLSPLPEHRQPSASQFKRDMSGIPASTLRRRFTWAAALLLTLVVATLFVWQPWRTTQSTEPLRAIPLTTLPGVERYPSFSPDGNHVAFSWTGPKQDNPDIYVQQIGAGSPLRLTTDPSNDYNPVWSPDGRSIVFLRRQSEAGKSEVRLIPPLGGPERKLVEIRVRDWMSVTPPHLTWCPDSSCLVVTDSPGEGVPDALYAISLETGEKRQLTNPRPPASGDSNPAISPDGSWLVFRRQIGGLYTGELYRLQLRRGITPAGDPQRLTLATLDANYPTWLPDSKVILFSAMQGLWRLAVHGESTPARLPFVGEDGLMPVVSRPPPRQPARVVYVRSFLDANIWRIETSDAGARATSPPVVSISSTRGESMVQLSPDGSRVAFASDRSGGWEIWLSDPDGSNAVQLTSMGARASGYPRWSPDGERIVFHSNLEGQWEVYIIPAAGGKPRNLTSDSASDYFPSFSRDGRWIYFNSNRTGEFRIWKILASGGNAVQVANDVGYAPLESPDGAYLYYVQTIDAPSPLWRRASSGGVPVKVLEGVVLANFVVLERGIYYIERPGAGGVHYVDLPLGETRLQFFDFATRKSATVASNLGNVDLPLTASPDGRTIFFSRVDSSVDDPMLVENFR